MWASSACTWCTSLWSPCSRRMWSCLQSSKIPAQVICSCPIEVHEVACGSMRYFTTFGASNSPRFVRNSVFFCEGPNFNFTGAFVTFEGCFSPRLTPEGSRGTRPTSLETSGFSAARGTRPSSFSVGDSRVRSEVQEVDFREQNSNVSNLVMPDEALLIAGNSIVNTVEI